MKIISKFKDYYDFMLGKYGIDEKIVFDRTKFLSESVNHVCEFNFNIYREKVSYIILVICGKYYPLISKYDTYKLNLKYRLINEIDIEDKNIRNDLHHMLPLDLGWTVKSDKVKKILKNSINGVYTKNLVELSKKLNCPIFIITTSSRTISHPHREILGNTVVDPYTPNLSRIAGIPAVYPPDQLFLDISFFIGNILNNNIDNSHLIVSNKDKIIKGGFDLKTSFRKM